MSSSICIAAKDGDLETLKSLIEAGKCINSTNPHGWTPLHLSVYNNRIACVEYLLSQKDVRIDAESHAGETPLFIACRAYYTVPYDIVEMLLKSGADPNIVNNDNKSALYCICEGPLSGKLGDHNYLKAELLIRYGASLNTPECFEGDTPIFAAIECLNSRLVELLLYAGADANLQREFDLCSPLIIAAQIDNFDVFQMMMPFVADVNVKTIDGRTALMVAQDHRIIKMLLDLGADPNIIAIDKPVTAVHLAAVRRNLNKLMLLLPKTKQSVLCNCKEYNLVALMISTVESLSDLIAVLDALEYLIPLEMDPEIFFISYSCKYFFPPIASLFTTWAIEAPKDVWERYVSVLFLFLSTGINVNPIGNQEDLMIAFIDIFKIWSPRVKQLLDILVNQGLNVDHFIILLDLQINHLFDRTEFNSTFLLHLIPYCISHGFSIYKRLQSTLDKSDLEQSVFNSWNLKSFCRSTIRKQLFRKCMTTQKFLESLNRLKIPDSLKDYIRFKYD